VKKRHSAKEENKFDTHRKNSSKFKESRSTPLKKTNSPVYYGTCLGQGSKDAKDLRAKYYMLNDELHEKKSKPPGTGGKKKKLHITGWVAKSRGNVLLGGFSKPVASLRPFTRRKQEKKESRGGKATS